MTTTKALGVGVGDLLRQPGQTKTVDTTVELADIDAAHEALDHAADISLALTSTRDDIELVGTVQVRWHGVCRRCLTELDLDLAIAVDERFSADEGIVAGGDALPIHGAQLDLRDLVRDEVLLSAGEERLCREACAGLCPQCGADLATVSCGCEAPVGDERWSVLDQLRDAQAD